MDYITTYSSIHFTPLDPKLEDISIRDIAHSLSLLSRANGHFPKFHSVAQHCIECANEAMARNLSKRTALACLLHDASEAYLADITRPVKKNLPDYITIENNLLTAIYKRFLNGITTEEEKLVKEIDDTLLYYEFFHFMNEELMEKPFITEIPDFNERPFKEVEEEYIFLFNKLYHEVIKEQVPEIKGILFDMDGLILDTEKLYTRFWMEAANSLGYPMDLERALYMRSKNRKLGEAIFKEWYGDETAYAKIRAKRIELMDAFIEEEGVDLKPGVHELLSYLKKSGIKTAIATSSPYERAKKHLSSVNAYDYFDEIISGYTVENGKPAPDIYLKAAASLNLTPCECFALEDSPTGLLAAFRAGCHPIMVPDLDKPDKHIEAILYAVADDLTKVIPLIENW